ncbi:hypothetical protein O6H91_22G018000 [Diphasiastrum complanatum]|uniref:Uncharacterized protein n=1 Tax=Diphasiastrum complanatum TaxID=34168 RepID=A0ACC2ADE5_DIPCM|nr:hypothetical protein O6H91_22G018000 [Diphasiastrum complanatum]
MNDEFKCEVAEVQIAALFAGGTSLKNIGIAFTGYPVIGYKNLIQTSGNCQNRLDVNSLLLLCPWDPKKCSSGCAIEVLVRMCYVKKSNAYLAKTKDVMDIDIIGNRVDDATTPRLNEDVLEETKRMALFKYQGPQIKGL